MLSFLFTIFVFIKNCALFILMFSYSAGQVIISGILVLIKAMQTLSESVLIVYNILIEDFGVFTNDLRSLFDICKKIGGTIGHFVIGSISAVIMGLKYSVNTVLILPSWLYDFILNLFSNIGYLLGIALLCLKQFVILIGFGIWFAITLFPFIIVSSITLFMYYIGYALQKTLEEIQTLFKFLQLHLCYFNLFVDFPSEALVGLIIGMCLIFVVLKFRVFCLSLIRYRSHNQIRTVAMEVPSVDNGPQTAEVASSELNNLKCIVCLDHPRNMLLLPCRHVCLCSNCDSQIRQSRMRICPVCRAGVGSSMKIFI